MAARPWPPCAASGRVRLFSGGAGNNRPGAWCCMTALWAAALALGTASLALGLIGLAPGRLDRRVLTNRRRLGALAALGLFLVFTGSAPPTRAAAPKTADRKSTRLNSSHVKISYAVFCLKKKKEAIVG